MYQESNVEEKSFSQRFKTVLKKKKISQVKVANALNLSRTAVNKWTKGGKIDDHNLDGLARFLEVDKIWLKYGNSARPLNTQMKSGISEVQLQESAEIVTWEWDLLSDEVVYSENVENVYGIKLRSNQDYWNMMGEKDRERLNNDYQKIIRDGGAHEMDFNIRVNGDSRWITSRATGIKGPNGKVNRLIGISMDNTERKLKELELQQSQRFFNALLEQSAAIVTFTDLDGEIQASNLNSKTDSINYPGYQGFIYNAFSESPDTLETAKNEGQANLSFEGRSMTVHFINNEGAQPFLMLIEN